MPLTRRALLSAAAAGSAATVLTDLSAGGEPARAASPPGDVVGKISVGYQGWFSCPGDGAPIGGWWHWSRDRFQPPSPSNTTIVSWPDLRDFTHTYPTAYPHLGNGGPAALFSSYDQQTVDTHFAWMRTYGIDTAALQRFNPVGDEGPTRDAMARKVRTAAEATGRKFYIMYDVTGWTNMQSELKTDWTTKMAAHTASPAYARQNGKPVVCVWGFGFDDDGRPFTPAACLDVVNWLKAQGCYVIGGVPTYWREGKNDSRTGFLDVYHAFHMLSPWMVGRTGTLDGLDWFLANVNTADQADCNAHGIDYQPCVLPGDLSSGHRRHGDFYWRSLYNMVRLGAQGLYVSMFDEFNEGNQIAKTAETAASVPAGSGIRALDEDGTFCSSDYYLRITTDGGRMLKGQLALTAVRPTQPTLTAGDLAAGKPVSASSANGAFAPGNAVDGSATTYWESGGGAFPQWFEVDLGAAYAVTRLVLRLPAGWERRTQTIAVQGGAATTYTFDPASGNTVTITLPGTAVRNLRLTFSGNSGWPAAQISQLQVYGDSTPPPATDLARGRATTASAAVQNYTSGNAVDGDAGTYWESANNAFPQWIQVDLGAATTVSRLVLKLPPSWGARTQTIAISDGTTTLSAAAPRVFDPASGNTVTITCPPTQARYVQATFTGNTGWPAGQLSALEAYSS
ncbi:galactose-binding domain-containing protein [Paractinoplanes atraurantiacus]|uniref:F5/8 type C domain-containing protein n=1 Tax=Paractinoplanes atraurantiacus TaxID=1036182 RepID=A0A285I6Z8_9ACTN|nr:discoidin domain-containing protein [Actinoplanes atraurantiacus]SNY42846.1 F5/8 type C domain-containing protein [Actinoplanes atraurantiacus]